MESTRPARDVRAWAEKYKDQVAALKALRQLVAAAGSTAGAGSR